MKTLMIMYGYHRKPLELIFHILTFKTFKTTIKTKTTHYFKNLRNIFSFPKLWEEFLFYKNA